MTVQKQLAKTSQLGSFWMLVAALGFATMGALVKTAATDLSSAELVFYRSLFGFLMIYVFIVTKKRSIKTPYLGKQVSRSLIGFFALFMFFYAIANLPLATAITLNYTSPLFLAGFMPLMLHEKPKKILYFAILISFIGVILLLQPRLAKEDLLACLLGLASGCGAGIAYLHVKQLGNLNEPDWRTVFYFTLISSIGAGIWMLLGGFHVPTLKEVPILLGIGASATIAQLALTRAYRTGKTLMVASLSYLTVVLSSIFGFVFWNEQLMLIEWQAIGLIIIGGVISIYSTQDVK